MRKALIQEKNIVNEGVDLFKSSFGNTFKIYFSFTFALNLVYQVCARKFAAYQKKSMLGNLLILELG